MKDARGKKGERVRREGKLQEGMQRDGAVCGVNGRRSKSVVEGREGNRERDKREVKNEIE